MTRKEIIYDKLLERLNHFSLDNEHSTGFGEALEEGQEQDSFLSLIEQLDQLRDKLQEDLNHERLPNDLSPILSVVESLSINYPDFPDARYAELLGMMHIIDRIKTEVYSEEDFKIEEDVQEDMFSLREIPNDVNIDTYFYHDTDDVSNSIVLISYKSISDLQDFFSEEAIPVELLFQLLAKLGGEHKLDLNKQYLLIKTAVSEQSMEATVKLHLVLSGNYFHFPLAYSEELNVHSSRKILPEREYQQFLDTLLIISEYNYQTDILDKYLRLYHVVENFMFRLPLVEMERNNNGTPFSIRDFQRLYKQVSTSELDALKSLLRKVLDETYDSTSTTFKEHVLDRWESLPSETLTATKITDLLSFLGITTSKGNSIEYGDVTDQNIHAVTSQLVYYYRNAIVHNKDTELHLTHETLTNHSILEDTALIVMKNFLIPCLEEIVFYLVIEDNSIVRFQHSTLKLWEDVA